MLVLLHCLHFVYPFEVAFHGKPTFSEKKNSEKKMNFCVWYGLYAKVRRWKKRWNGWDFLKLVQKSSKQTIIWKNDDFWTKCRQTFRCTHEDTHILSHTVSAHLPKKSTKNATKKTKRWGKAYWIYFSAYLALYAGSILI